MTLTALFLSAEICGAAPVFERDVLPIFSTHCLSCHGGLKQRGELDLRSLATALKGGQSGSVIEGKNAAASLLWQKIAHDEMPKATLKLTAAEKKVIREWIDAGGPGVKSSAMKELPAGAKPRDPHVVAAEIDRYIEQALQAEQLTAAPRASDLELLRRLTLDVIGRLPSADDVRRLQASKDPDKIGTLLDELLSRPEYGQHWATIWHHELMPLTDGKRVYDQSMLNWLNEAFQRNRPWDDLVRDLITAEGPADAKPQIAFLLANKDPEKISVRAGELFLGISLECAECHNHPMTHWRQKEDFWAFAAFFSQLRSSKKGQIVSLTDQSDKGKSAPTIRIPSAALTSANSSVPASFPGETTPQKLEAPYRQRLAEWMTNDANSRFAEAAANRWWRHFFGRGLVNPVADMHPGNPPSHPEILTLLAHEFSASGSDCRHLVRCICLTKAYQRSSEADADNEELERYFGRMPLRLLTPDVLYDAFTQALNVKDLDLPVPPPARKNDPPTPVRPVFVNMFDQSKDVDVKSFNHGVLQLLQFMNGKDFNHGKLVQELASSEKSTEQCIDELYLRTVSRPPAAAESARMTAFVNRQQDRATGLQSVLWLLLNSSEFVFNH